MQVAEIFWDAELGPALVVLRQQDAEIVIPHIGREVVSGDAINPPVILPVQDGRLHDLDQGETLELDAVTNACLGRDDLKLDRISVTVRVVLIRQGVEAVVYHGESLAQVLPPPCAPREIGKVGRGPRAVRRAVILVEADGLDAVCDVFLHPDMLSERPGSAGR